MPRSLALSINLFNPSPTKVKMKADKGSPCLRPLSVAMGAADEPLTNGVLWYSTQDFIHFFQFETKAHFSKEVNSRRTNQRNFTKPIFSFSPPPWPMFLMHFFFFLFISFLAVICFPILFLLPQQTFLLAIFLILLISYNVLLSSHLFNAIMVVITVVACNFFLLLFSYFLPYVDNATFLLLCFPLLLLLLQSFLTIWPLHFLLWLRLDGG